MGDMTNNWYVLKSGTKFKSLKVYAISALLFLLWLALLAGDCSAMKLNKDTPLHYCANPPILFKGGTVVILDAKKLVVSGVLAIDTSLAYSANPPILFKGGTLVTFQVAPPQNRCLVGSGTLARDTRLHQVGNAGSLTLFKAGTRVTFNTDGLAQMSGVNANASGEGDIPYKSVMIFDNFNGEAVVNMPQQTSVFSISKPVRITSIRDYHWNNGHGSDTGSIWLVDQVGHKYGPWRASGVPGAGGALNAYWVVSPNVKIGAGTYTIRDSDPATWSHNPRSMSAGMSQVEGYYESKTISDTRTTESTHATTQTTTTQTTSPTSSPNQGGGWHLVGSPEIYKNPFPKDSCDYFGYKLSVSDGSAIGSQSWKDCSNQTKCSGTYTGSVTWTKPPAYIAPGSKVSFTGNVRTTANNTCGYRNKSSTVTVKINNGIFLEVIESRSPTGTAVYTAPKGSPNSTLVIEVLLQAASLNGKVKYTYVYK